MFDTLKHRFRRGRGTLLHLWSENTSDVFEGRLWLKALLLLLVFYLLIAVLLGVYWSSEPKLFSVEDVAGELSQQSPEKPLVVGAATTATLIHVSRVLLEKPGGYLSNDVTPPGIWLDNMPSWEYGVLAQVRDLSRVLQESFSRSQSQSAEDRELKQAHAQFSFDSASWILPATEDEYRQAIAHTEDYLHRLVDQRVSNAQFYARADNLRYWLGSVEVRLGSLSQKLSASVGRKPLNTDLAGDAAAKQSTQAPSEFEVKTPWLEIDDAFYEARGAAWALVHFLKAIEIDFADVLEKKNAAVSLRQIVRELEGTQEQLHSPMVLNGSGFGVLANHSLVMANYISRANAALIDLRELLSKG